MTVDAAAMEPSSPASITQRATRPTTTRRRSKKTYRTRRRMSLGTIWISIMCTTHGTSRVGQYNTAGVAEVGQEAPAGNRRRPTLSSGGDHVHVVFQLLLRVGA